MDQEKRHRGDWLEDPNLAKKAWLTLDQHLMEAQTAGADVHWLWSEPRR